MGEPRRLRRLPSDRGRPPDGRGSRGAAPPHRVLRGHRRLRLRPQKAQKSQIIRTGSQALYARKAVAGLNPKRVVLDNGVTVIAKANHTNPTVSMLLGARVGAFADPPERDGTDASC